MEISTHPSWSRLISWLLILAAVGYVAVGVNVPGARRSGSSDNSVAANDIQLRLTARVAVGAKQLQPSSASNDERLIRNLDKLNASDQERICVAIVAGEVLGAKEAIERLSHIDASESARQDDVNALTQIYTEGSLSLDESQRRLVQRYGWYGELALVSDRSPDDPQRQAVLAPARQAMITATAVGAGLVLIGGLAFLLFLTAIVLLLLGVVRPRFSPIAPNVRPVFLEAFAVYIVSFVIFLEVVSRFVRGGSMGIYLLATLILPIGLCWPVLRGMSWRETLAGFGWHRGRAIILEPLFGIVGYLSLLPVAIVGLVITYWLAHVVGITPSHPIFRELTGSTRQLVFVYVLACVWAPIMEETFFRGALYNHLRGRRGWLTSSIVVGLLFALVHPQGWTAIPALGSIGMVLAWIREWRGSILASMTAHALNNGVAITLVVLLLR